MLHAQTRGNFTISDVFVSSDDEVATNPQVQAQLEADLTHSEDIGGPSTAPLSENLNM
ncbi:hypothetical protein THS5294_02741 [Thalassobacter stenotrophicus]|uniref:Uncharacterized protein n=3 Tax=Roseobacteraceae TaxID=2854170 RepID=A0A0U1NNM6_9RHOB|nr:hypothetical protein NIG5292_02378 [Nereida ignava]CUH61433.1 hypothetical protein THS5294_02741 [Thalassobacter stenotrophicus]SFJ80096.1 hypothetical protein SAMN02745667_02420 [Nereida ignava DSM 16309]SHJ09943.1 hypothetical protein SAMN02744035_02618 [Thalassobacter stenotrophicus DSM 16310]